MSRETKNKFLNPLKADKGVFLFVGFLQVAKIDIH